MAVQTATKTSIQAAESIIPRHLGLILDGNRRWARARNLPTFEGHRRGYENLKDITKAAVNRGIKYISAFIFSTENWQRSKEEVNYLMKLALWVASSEVDEVHKENIRVKFLGSTKGINPKLLQAIARAEAKTAKNTRGTLGLCFNYGGHQEIADSVAGLVKAGIKSKDVTPEAIAERLYAPDMPPIDLLIRTSGEQRISNFMLWRAAYAELLFINKHWPDFTEADLDAAIAEYASRHRRFGK
jgi:undecaprenyl diphosphate synthase